MRAVVGELLMVCAVAAMLPALWRVLRAMLAGGLAMRAGHAGRWMLWDPLRLHDIARAPPAAQPHLHAMRFHLRRALPFMALSLALAVPAAILAG
jgi:hypothetical protein